MARDSVQRGWWSIVLAVGMLIGSVPQAWSLSEMTARRRGPADVVSRGQPAPTWNTPTQEPDGNTANAVDVQEWEFDSYETLVEWLRFTIEDPEAFEAVLDQLEYQGLGAVCLAPQTRPSRIDVTLPFRFKVFQISFLVGIGDCGLVLCARLQYSMAWFIAPPSGGFFFGPFPRNSPEVCQGQQTSTTGFVLLVGSIPAGVYSLNFRADSLGFGTFVVGGVMITVR